MKLRDERRRQVQFKPSLITIFKQVTSIPEYSRKYMKFRPPHHPPHGRANTIAATKASIASSITRYNVVAIPIARKQK